MPRVVVPSESDERAAGHSQRRRKALLVVLAAGCLLAGGVFGVQAWRDREKKTSAADSAFVSAPAWPKQESRPLAPRPTLANREFLLQLGAYADKKEAEALADRLIGLAWPVSIVVPVSATDSLHKVVVSGIADKSTARSVADSLGAALRLKVTIIEPTGTRSR